MRCSFIFVVLISFLVSCKKEKPTVVDAPVHLVNGMLVLNEGLFQLNNSSLNWINSTNGEVNSEFFTQKTGRLLGDTGNDMKRYGNKIYIVVNVSSTIEILDATTGSFIYHLPMLHDNQPKQPRNIEFANGKAFVTCFDGFVDVIDTTSFEILQRIPVGLNPEDIIRSGNQLYVSNSGGLNGPHMDSTVSIINLNTLTETNRIVVGKNPGQLAVDQQGEVYVIARGNYSTIPSRLKRIDFNLTTHSFDDFEATGITTYGSKLLVINANLNTSTNQIGLFDANSESLITMNYLPLTDIHTVYGVFVHPTKNTIFVLDGNGFTTTGFVHEFSSSNKVTRKYPVGLNPNSILFFD